MEGLLVIAGMATGALIALGSVFLSHWIFNKQ